MSSVPHVLIRKCGDREIQIPRIASHRGASANYFMTRPRVSCILAFVNIYFHFGPGHIKVHMWRLTSGSALSACFLMTRDYWELFWCRAPMVITAPVGSQSRVAAEQQPSKSVHDFYPERGYYAGLDLNRKTPVTQKFLSNWSLFILIQRPTAVTWPAWPVWPDPSPGQHQSSFVLCFVWNGPTLRIYVKQ